MTAESSGELIHVVITANCGMLSKAFRDRGRAEGYRDKALASGPEVRAFIHTVELA